MARLQNRIFTLRLFPPGEGTRPSNSWIEGRVPHAAQICELVSGDWELFIHSLLTSAATIGEGSQLLRSRG